MSPSGFPGYPTPLEGAAPVAQASASQVREKNATVAQPRGEVVRRSTGDVCVHFGRDGGDAPGLEGLAGGLGVEGALPDDLAGGGDGGGEPRGLRRGGGGGGGPLG